MTDPTPAVICCVSLDGSPSAIEYAAREALLGDAPLHIIHVLRMPAVDAYAGVYGGVQGTKMLALKAGELPGPQGQIELFRQNDNASALTALL